MATTCNFGQIPDIRFTTLCCKGRLIIDSDCNLNIATASFENIRIGVGGKLCIPNIFTNFEGACIDFTGSTIRGFDSDVTGNFNGTILGNLVEENIESIFIQDIFGNIIGNILGNVLGNINGSLVVDTLIGNVIQSNTINANLLIANIIQIDTLQGNLCVPAGNALTFKPGSELRGNICIPQGTIISFKNSLDVIIDTAFGTQNDGDILTHKDGKTRVLPIGSNGNILVIQGNCLVWSNIITVSNVCANTIIGNFFGNIITDENEFNEITVDQLVVNNTIQTPTLCADKLVGNLCGNVIGNGGGPIFVDGLFWQVVNDLQVLGNFTNGPGFVGSTEIESNLVITDGNLTFPANGLDIGQETGNIVLNSGDLIVCPPQKVQAETYRIKNGNAVIFDANISVSNIEGITQLCLFGNSKIIANASALNWQGANAQIGNNMAVCGDLFIGNLATSPDGAPIYDCNTNTLFGNEITIVNDDVNIEGNFIIDPLDGFINFEKGNVVFKQANAYIGINGDGDLAIGNANLVIEQNLQVSNILAEKLAIKPPFTPPVYVGGTLASHTGTVPSVFFPPVIELNGGGWVTAVGTASSFFGAAVVSALVVPKTAAYRISAYFSGFFSANPAGTLGELTFQLYTSSSPGVPFLASSATDTFRGTTSHTFYIEHVATIPMGFHIEFAFTAASTAPLFPGSIVRFAIHEII